MTRDLARPTPGHLDAFDAWAERGRAYGRVVRNIQWAVAEWVMEGERRFGERASAHFEECGYAPHSLLNIVSVYRAFPPERQRHDLSFSHHEALTKLPARDQDAWLDRAARGRWSVSRLREEVKRALPGRGRDPDAGMEPDRPHLVVGMLLDVGNEGLCKITGIYPRENAVDLRCVRLT